MKSFHLNLCVVPKTSVVTSSTFPTIVALVIEPPTKFFEEISEDMHLIVDEKFNTLVIPPPLEIIFQDSHPFSFKH